MCKSLCPGVMLATIIATCSWSHPQSQPSTAPPIAPAVTLTLERASAMRMASNDIVLFKVIATIDNSTGDELTVKSRCFSAFDGLSLEILDKNDAVLKSVSYLQHQSPSKKTREHPLPAGKTTHDLRFPIANLPPEQDMFRIRISGTLPESGHDAVLVSKPVIVRIAAVLEP